MNESFPPVIIEIKASKMLPGEVGLFAMRDLPKGQIINDASLIREQLYSLEIYRSLDDITRRQVDKFVTVAYDGFFCIPNINYMPTSFYCNHSCDPNVGFDGHDNMVLIKDVKAGDELCIDYAFSITNPDWKLECHCGSSKCRKFITGNDWKNPEYFNANKDYMSI